MGPPHPEERMEAILIPPVRASRMNPIEKYATARFLFAA